MERTFRYIHIPLVEIADLHHNKEFFYDIYKCETKELKNFQSSHDLTDSHSTVVQWLTINPFTPSCYFVFL